jgi:hypothetical protein
VAVGRKTFRRGWDHSRLEFAWRHSNKIKRGDLIGDRKEKRGACGMWYLTSMCMSFFDCRTSYFRFCDVCPVCTRKYVYVPSRYDVRTDNKFRTFSFELCGV